MTKHYTVEVHLSFHGGSQTVVPIATYEDEGVAEGRAREVRMELKALLGQPLEGFDSVGAGVGRLLGVQNLKCGVRHVDVSGANITLVR